MTNTTKRTGPVNSRYCQTLVLRGGQFEQCGVLSTVSGRCTHHAVRALHNGELRSVVPNVRIVKNYQPINAIAKTVKTKGDNSAPLVKRRNFTKTIYSVRSKNIESIYSHLRKSRRVL